MAKPAFIKRGEVMERLGLARWSLEKLEQAGVIEPVKLKGLKWRLYRTADVERLAEGKGNENKREGEHD